MKEAKPKIDSGRAECEVFRLRPNGEAEQAVRDSDNKLVFIKKELVFKAMHRERRHRRKERGAKGQQGPLGPRRSELRKRGAGAAGESTSAWFTEGERGAGRSRSELSALWKAAEKLR